jgi:choline monooxygenase
MPRFFVDPDISIAKTLDKRFYTDPGIFEETKEKIFANSWQYAGESELVTQAGQCYPFTLLEHFLNEPLVLTKDMNEKLHCLSNVCTHRGTTVIHEPCITVNLKCRYHGRQFRPDGTFVSMPEFKGVKNFPAADDDLVQLPLFSLGPLLFTSLKKDADTKPFFDAMQQRTRWLPLDDFIFKSELTKHYTVNAHWALYCDNYLEGFHIPFVHARLNAVIDFSNYTTELFEWSNLQVGIGKGNDVVFDLPDSSPDHGKKIAAYYFFVFPNLMFNFYPWGLSLNVVQPVSLTQTKVSFYTFVWKDELLNKGAGSALDIVEREDEEVVESVQKGIQSRFYTHGRYSVNREQGTHHFHRMIADFMER